MPPLSILIWLPALCGVLGAILPSRLARVPGVLALTGSVAALALAIGYLASFHSGASGLQHVTDVVWISELGIHYKLGISGLNVFLVGLTTLLFAAATLAASLGSRPTRSRARSCSGFSSCSPSPLCSARSLPRTWPCSSRSST